MVSPVYIRPALVVLVTMVIIGILIPISRNGSNHTAPVQPAFQQLPQNIDIALKQARFSEMKDGSVAWELVAGKVEYDKSGEIAYLTGGIRMVFTGNKSHGTINVSSDSGEYLGNNRDIKLRGNVHVLTENGASFDTDSIEYRAAASQFKTADVVAFHQEKLTLHAAGMEMDVNDQQARFFKSIDAIMAGDSVVGPSARPVPESADKPAAKQAANKKHK